MKANNNYNLTGRLVRDPEFTPGNMPRARIRVAVDGFDRQTKQRKADFFTVTVFGRTAEAVNQFCTKGSYISVSGELRQNEYTDKSGVIHRGIELIGSDVVFGPKAPLSGGGSPIKDDDDPFGFNANN